MILCMKNVFTKKARATRVCLIHKDYLAKTKVCLDSMNALTKMELPHNAYVEIATMADALGELSELIGAGAKEIVDDII